MSIEPGPGPITPLPIEPIERQESRRDRRRRRRRREREEFATLAATPAVASRPRRPQHQLRRRIIAVILAVAAVAILVPLTLWSRYATSYVTSHNATVKGPISNVGTQLAGVLTSVEVDAGQRVTAGQVLARFEDHQLAARVLRAKAKLSEALARSASAQSRIEAAQSQNAEALVKRDQRLPLAKNGVITLDEMRSAETRLQTTQALEKTAVADYSAANAEVSTAQAEVALAEADLQAAQIRAPADGWVLRRISEPGASVVVGQPVFALWIGKDLWVEAWIEEDQLSNIAIGNDVKVTINSFPGRVFTGTVESIGVSTDFELPETAVPQSRTERMRSAPVVPVRVRLDQRTGLFPGLSAVVAIQRTPSK